jgi:Fe-S cluster assembly protein SufD
MSQAVKETSSYREALRELSEAEGARVPAWVGELRAEALGRFERLGFPTTDQEDWKYTNVAALARREFRPAEAAKALDAAQVEPFLYEEARGSRLVFVNGHFNQKLSSLDALPRGVIAADLASALRGEHAELLRERLTRSDRRDVGAFAALNTAFLGSGAFIHVPPDVSVASPVHLLFLSTPEAEGAFTPPRVVVVAGRGSSATVVESYAALGEAEYFTNAVVEVSLGESARLVHYKVQAEGERAFHVASTRAELERAASYDLTTITLGARLSRHDVEVVLDHEGAECWVDGLYLVGDGQHADTHSLIDHRVPRCTSHQNYKGILDGRSRAVFNGRVYVHPDAQQTDAFQSNKNLLLSSDARVDTKPQLEIYADDVKCAHGATVGQLEEEEYFYLVSRGLRPALARNLLTYGFAEEIVEKIKVGSVKRQLDEAILNRLHADFEA